MDGAALFEQLEARLHARPGPAVNLPSLQLREAAVLVPLLVRAGEPRLVFTRRPDTLRIHAGQIVFPGGSRDPEDETPLHTALRETEEELGIPRAAVRVLGMLEETPTTTLFRIRPFLGVIPPDVPYLPSAAEIAEVFEVPLAHLLDPRTRRMEKRVASGIEWDVYFYDYGPHVIWGATARIVRDFIELVVDLPAIQALLPPT